MLANKHLTKMILAVMAAAVLLCLLAIAFSGKLTALLGGTGVKMEYESKLFNTDEVISIDIEMDEDAWEEMLENALAEEYYVCNVTVNGEKFRNVAVRPKGNTSLSAIAMDPDSDRYSLKLEFDHFVEGQTCFGLDKLILNNNYADATNMKEAIVYDMYQYLGADASLYNYAEVSVNGEYRGVYLALEGVEQSFMLRNFGTQDGALYKPDTMEMGGGEDTAAPFSAPDMKMPDGAGFDPSEFSGMTPPADAEGFSFSPPDRELPSDFPAGDMPSGFPTGNMPENSGQRPSFEGFSEGETPDGSAEKPADAGGFSRSGGANLNYVDDDLDSYQTIWDGEVTKTGKADHKRVVKALKNISEGNDLETYLDVDNVLKYMAVHTFAVNQDSLSGSMAHNYYLYEYDGKLNIFPWDYNLSFGGMSAGKSADATSMVNDAIDTPFDGTEFFDALLENEEYRARYHAYLQQLVDEYVEGGRFDEVYKRIRKQIDALAETDPTAFYSYEEYLTAAELLHETVQLRAESIRGQLDGAIPSTDEAQQQDASALVDALHIDVAAMGQFNMGGVADRGAEAQTGGAQTAQLPEGFDAGKLPDGFDGKTPPEAAGTIPSGQPAANSGAVTTVAVCMAIMLAVLIAVLCIKRRR